MLPFVPILFFITLSANVCFGQLVVEGKVTNKDSEPIEFVSIYAMSSDSSTVVAGAVTDSLGGYELSLSPDTYLLVAKNVDFLPDSSWIDLSTSTILPTIQLEERITTIDDVTIIAKRPRIVRKVDRLVFNYKDAVSVDGGTAIDALKVTPGVIVGRDGISMFGKKSVVLMINGKGQSGTPSQMMDLLKTIDADRIKTIEVITTPPASFDAGENIGIININLVSPLSDHWNAYVHANNYLANYSDASSRGRFTYQKGKFGINTNLSYSYGKWLSLTEQRIEYDSQNISTLDSLIDQTNRLNWGVDLNYVIDNRNFLSGNYFGSYNRPSNRGLSSSILINPQTEQIDSVINTVGNDKDVTFLSGGTLRYTHVIDSLGKIFAVSTDIFSLSEASSQNFTTRFDQSGSNFIGITDGQRDILNYSFKFDCTLPLKKVNLDFGTKYSLTNSTSELNYSISNLTLLESYNRFEFAENTFSIYAQGKTDLSDALSLKVGLRLESTQTIGQSELETENSVYNYTRLFPTGYLSYTVSKNHSLALDYSKRVNRPRFSMLNPFRIYNTSYSFVAGNPLLRPSFSDELSLNHIFKSKLNTRVYFRYVQNDFSLLTRIEEGTIIQSSMPQNYLDRRDFGASQSISFDVKNRFSMYFSGDVSYRKSLSKDSITRAVTEGWKVGLSNSNSVYLNKKKTYVLSLDVSYAFPYVYGIDFYQAIFNLDVTFRAMFFKKKLVVDIGLLDAFATNKMQWTTDINNIYLFNSYRSDNPYFQFSLSYSLGSSKIKNPKVRNGNSTEQRRSR